MSRDFAIFIGCIEVAQKRKVESKRTYSLLALHDHIGYTGRLPHLQRGDQEACRSLGRKVTSLVAPDKHSQVKMLQNHPL